MTALGFAMMMVSMRPSSNYLVSEEYVSWKTRQDFARSQDMKEMMGHGGDRYNGWLHCITPTLSRSLAAPADH